MSDITIEQLDEFARSTELSKRERAELHQLRRRVFEMESMQPPPPPEVEEHAMRLASPLLTLTSGGIQYQVDIYLRQ